MTENNAEHSMSVEDTIINHSLATKLLFQSDFKTKNVAVDEDPTDLLHSVSVDSYKLKLNMDWSDALSKFKRHHELQQEQKIREGGAKKQTIKDQPVSTQKANQSKTQEFITSFIQDLTSKKEKEKTIKQFETYSERVNKAPSTIAANSTSIVPKSTSEAIVPVSADKNRMQLDLAETTRLGSIKANNIRKLIKPTWHKPFKLYRVTAAHSGWVRCISVSPCNQYFCTGSNDRTIKFWDLATGKLKITLTGHINAVRGVEFSKKFPMLFSCAEDKTVKCWDLEVNKVVRNYHGHLSGVYALKLHEGLNLLVTGGRDSAARVWDMRLRTQVHVLAGHGHTVGSVATQEFEPQVITGGYDSMIKTWDIGTGRCIKSLTNHKKSIRALLVHPTEYTFASAASDNIKVWKGAESQFLRNISGHHSILNALSINDDNVLASGGDDGSIKLWDWKSGYNFQSILSKPQPGSIAAENGIFALQFDRSGTRLITGQCDKTIKYYKQDDSATEETHPISDYRIQFDRK